MAKSKCMFHKGGIVLDEKCNKVVRRWICDIDYYDNEIGCNKYCHGYTVNKKESEVK